MRRQKRHILEVKEDLRFVYLLHELSRVVDKTLGQIHRKMKWLKFAKRIKRRYQMFDHKEAQWMALDKIAQDVANKHPNYPIGQIVDTLANLVNNTVADSIHARGLKLHTKIESDEHKFSKTPLIEIVAEHTYIPRYPWYKPTDVFHEHYWRAKDLTDNEPVEVKKLVQDEYIVYLIEELE